MMDDTEIKQEFPVFEHQCRGCLSIGRKLSPLGGYDSVFTNLISDLECPKYQLLDKIRLCWECLAILRKVQLFKQQLSKAFASYQLQEYIYGSLSHLTTIILNDATHTVYVCDVVTEVKASEELSDHCGDDVADDDDGDVKSEEIVTEVAVKEPQKPKNNLWATKRVLQNKKPKFKIITDYTEKSFNRIQIKNEDLSMYLENQRQSEYFKSKKYKCIQCVKSFNDDKSLLVHNVKYHKKPTSYICDICGSNIRTKRHLSTHIHKHYNTYICTICSYTYQEKSVMKWHYKKHHKRVFQCIKCRLKFGNRKEFFKHYKQWHEKFICDYCGVSFKMRYCIKNHIKKQHSPFECVECNKRFARYNGLWLHNKTTHCVTNSAYCVECDRKYPDVYRYKWHLANSAKHNNRTNTRVSCPGCDKVFSKNIYMKDHYNLVHLKYYKYRCEQCDKNFIRNADLVKHTRRIHEGILPPKNKICYMCGRGFTTNKILRNHLLTHTGERPHACVTCGARFAQHTTLAAHVRALHAS